MLTGSILKTGIMKYGSPASWTELASAIAVGRLLQCKCWLIDVQTYAYNREQIATIAYNF